MAYTTIDDPEAYFQIVLYTGNGSADHAITLPGDTDMQPDLVWIKNRDATDAHCVFDSVRGATKVITIPTAAEATDADTLDTFTSDGFQVDADVKVNTNAEDYVAWCWKESATAGFDIVSYTGDGVIGTTVAHSLSAKPEFIITKARAGTNANNEWYTWHVGLAANKNINLSRALAEFTDPGEGLINTTQNTSTFGFYSSDSSGVINVNEDSTTFIAYLFAPKQGFSKFGSYVGNSNADGAFIYLGFRPAFIMIKRTNGTQWWIMKDNKRDGVGGGNVNTYLLYPNDSAVEETNSNAMDLLSNGFKFREGTSGGNNSGGTYIYMAFAEAPFVNSKGAPCNAR